MRSRRRVLTIGLTAALGALGLVTGAGPAARASAHPAASGGSYGNHGLRINQLQVIGTHNSYHDEATPAEEKLRASVDPAGEQALEYDHPRLGRQLARQHVRQLELDLWADPEGGRYVNPLLRYFLGEGPYHPAVMTKPGTKVFHIQEIDYRSTCLTFRRCLGAIKHWSDANPGHLPVTVLVELKDEPLPATFPFPVPAPIPWTGAQLDTVDTDIRAVFGERDLITPDDVRGPAPTLEQAVLTRGWPTVAASRGKVMFLMDNSDQHRTDYLAGHPSLAGRVLFTNSRPGQPDAAFVEENDPTGANQARIQDEVRAGYMVRTRADVDTVQARTGDTSLRDAALASGAQWVSTDYPVRADSERFGTGYVVRLPGGAIARCTPVAPANAPKACRNRSLARG